MPVYDTMPLAALIGCEYNVLERLGFRSCLVHFSVLRGGRRASAKDLVWPGKADRQNTVPVLILAVIEKIREICVIIQNGVCKCIKPEVGTVPVFAIFLKRGLQEPSDNRIQVPPA